MGRIVITVEGSFVGNNKREEFSAMRSGHARTVSEAIVWLTEVVMPDAIRHDHELHEDRKFPEDRFGLAETQERRLAMPMKVRNYVKGKQWKKVAEWLRELATGLESKP